MAKIIFKISPDGEVEFEVDGVKGTSCSKLTKPFEEALGMDNPEVQFKDEYFEQEQEETVKVG